MPRAAGTLAQANDAVTVTDMATSTKAVFELDSVTAAMNVSFEATWDGTNWDSLVATRIDAVAGGDAVAITVGNAQTWRYQAATHGALGVRARVSAFTSGSVAARLLVN